MANKKNDFDLQKTTKGANALKKYTDKATKKERKTYTKAEELDAMENMKTSGLKGVKMPRMNLAFKPSVYEYLNTVCAHNGMTRTQFINALIESNMKENKKLYEKIKEDKDQFKI